MTNETAREIQVEEEIEPSNPWVDRAIAAHYQAGRWLSPDRTYSYVVKWNDRHYVCLGNEYCGLISVYRMLTTELLRRMKQPPQGVISAYYDARVAAEKAWDA